MISLNKYIDNIYNNIYEGFKLGDDNFKTGKDKFKYRPNDIFDLKAIFGLSIIVLASMVICIFLYSNNIIRYIAIAILLIVLAIMHKKIIRLLKSLKMKR